MAVHGTTFRALAMPPGRSWLTVLVENLSGEEVSPPQQRSEDLRPYVDVRANGMDGRCCGYAEEPEIRPSVEYGLDPQLARTSSL